jgi:hypothetical protein
VPSPSDRVRCRAATGPCLDSGFRCLARSMGQHRPCFLLMQLTYGVGVLASACDAFDELRQGSSFRPVERPQRFPAAKWANFLLVHTLLFSLCTQPRHRDAADELFCCGT